ncbi:hypothetical protein EZW90_21925 [Salmonella enterica subsp. enterica serovar Agbeni]|nr:hypothetical protein [Salmonella enterica subsp. enterica serovar Agbeni]
MSRISTYMTREWFTVQDCEQCEHFPKGAHNVRRKLDALLEGREELKRQRKGSKGYEYHASILPGYIRQSMGLGSSEQPTTAATSALDQNLNIWIMIFKKMTPEQQQYAVDTFFSGGIKELMPAVADIGNPARREILGQYSEHGRVETAGDDVGPQDMKKAG